MDIEVDWRGFELHPETPKGGMLMSARFPGPRLVAMRQRIRQFAASFGLHEMGEPERVPNTRRALAMAEYARDQGRLATFRDHAMDAHWKLGQDIEKDDDLARIAQAAGLDPKAALEAADAPQYQQRIDDIRVEAHKKGITAIPTFVFGEMVIVGAQPYEVLKRAAKAKAS